MTHRNRHAIQEPPNPPPLPSAPTPPISSPLSKLTRQTLVWVVTVVPLAKRSSLISQTDINRYTLLDKTCIWANVLIIWAKEPAELNIPWLPHQFTSTPNSNPGRELAHTRLVHWQIHFNRWGGGRMRRTRQWIAGWIKNEKCSASANSFSPSREEGGGDGGGGEAHLKTEPALHSHIHPYPARGSLKIH